MAQVKSRLKCCVNPARLSYKFLSLHCNIFQSKIANSDSDGDDDDDDQMEGYWQRRRRLDGALNRVPLGFYTKVRHLMCTVVLKLRSQLSAKVWKVLEKCQSLRMQTTNALFHGLTQEVGGDCNSILHINVTYERLRFFRI